VCLHEESRESTPAVLAVEFLGNVKMGREWKGGNIRYKLPLLFREGKQEDRMLVGLPLDSYLGMVGGTSWRVLLIPAVCSGLASVLAQCTAGI
jgi:hypothetical protein